jgi:predicted SprT family Zn-dependent metalloprotease
MKLIIKNTSKWPTPALKILSAWVVDQIGLASVIDKTIFETYTIKFTNSSNGTSGCAWKTHCIVRANRRLKGPWPWIYRDSRFYWAPEITLNNRIEALVKLIAHEMAHAFEKGRTGKPSQREFFAIDLSKQILEKFRIAWPELRKKIWKAMRKDHLHTIAQSCKKASTRTPEKRKIHAEAKLRKWQTALKLAQTKIKIYTKKIAYYTKKEALCQN